MVRRAKAFRSLGRLAANQFQKSFPLELHAMLKFINNPHHRVSVDDAVLFPFGYGTFVVALRLALSEQFIQPFAVLVGDHLLAQRQHDELAALAVNPRIWRWPVGSKLYQAKATERIAKRFVWLGIRPKSVCDV